LLFGFAPPTPLGLWPREGGLLELSGVFGGSLSLARSAAFSCRSAAFSCRNAAFSASNAATRSSTRATSVASSASFSAAVKEVGSSAGVTARLTHNSPRRTSRKNYRPVLLLRPETGASIHPVSNYATTMCEPSLAVFSFINS
jgi:hypothetical protein